MRHELAGVSGYRPGPLVLDMGPGRQQSLQEDMVVGGLVVVGQPAKREMSSLRVCQCPFRCRRSTSEGAAPRRGEDCVLVDLRGGSQLWCERDRRWGRTAGRKQESAVYDRAKKLKFSTLRCRP